MKPQAYHPEHPSFVQGALIIASCMVAAIILWGGAVVLLALGGPR